jgi:2,3-dihydroxyphenylpropionate 1,2-dioxygenase
MSIVAALAGSHAPGITGWPENAPPEQVERFHKGYGTLRDRLAAARPDLLLILTPEHWVNFFLNNMPPFCLGIGESFEGPAEDPAWLRVPKATISGDSKRARALYEALSREVDLAFSEELLLDHGAMVPLHFLTPKMELPVIPLFMNCLAPPLPPLSRCYRVGQILGEVLRAWPERVALLATGGLSHWPAMPQAGKINVEFDRRFLEALAQGRGEELTRYADREIERDAGPGAHEIRTWLTLAGALSGVKGGIIAYEAVAAWATGCGIFSFEITS